MELDKRIKEGKRPLTCFDLEEAEEYVGKKCYISNEYDFYRNLDFTQQKILNGVEDCEMPFHYDQDKQAEFCLPCEWVKEPEKKYRPFSIDSWLLNNNTGDVIHFRRKDNAIEHYMMFTGYSTEAGTDMTAYGIGAVILGGYQYAFQTLFESYEIMINGEWQPFGVIEDD